MINHSLSAWGNSWQLRNFFSQVELQLALPTPSTATTQTTTTAGKQIKKHLGSCGKVESRRTLQIYAVKTYIL